jgi:hypothetical protein
MENWISLESSSDIAVSEPSQALSAVSTIRLILSGSSKDDLMEEESDDDDDDYSLKVGMVCFSSSGRYLGLNPPDIQQARRWAKVQVSVPTKLIGHSIQSLFILTLRGWTGS